MTTTPTTYRKKPVEIEAMQLTGDNARDVAFWAQGRLVPGVDLKTNEPTHQVDIVTLEGTMRAIPGDYVIRGVQGEFYPCKPDIFAATYEEVAQ